MEYGTCGHWDTPIEASTEDSNDARSTDTRLLRTHPLNQRNRSSPHVSSRSILASVVSQWSSRDVARRRVLLMMRVHGDFAGAID